MPIAMRSRLPKPPTPKREKKVKPEEKEEEVKPEEATQAPWVRPLVGTAVAIIAVAALVSFYQAVFRDLPPHIDVSR